MPASKDSLQTAIESNGTKFQIKTGNAKYECNILDRTTHERTKATRANSTNTQSSTSSASTRSSTSN